MSGLNFRRRDSLDLARKIARAAETPGLWDELRAGIPPEPPRWMHDHVRILSGYYQRLLERPRAAPERVGLEEVRTA